MIQSFAKYNSTGGKDVDGRSKHAFFKPVIQPKLTVNQRGDVYEQQADEVADKVMRMSHTKTIDQPFFRPAVSSVHRKCSECEAEEKQLQRKEDTAAAEAGASIENYVGSLSGGRPLGESEKNFFEPAIGYDFSNVRLHTDATANRSATAVNALAYTHGDNIVFGAGQYQPQTDEGKRLLAHELTHVVQQQSGLKQVQREEQKPDRYEELKDDKKAKEIFEKLNPGVLGRYCSQNCPAVAEALEEYLKTGKFPDTKCDPLTEGNYGYDISDTNFSDSITGWTKFFKAASAKLKKHGDFLVIEAERSDKQVKENNLTKWHYFLILNIKGKNFIVDAYSKEVNEDITEYTTRLKATSYRYADGDFKIKKVRVTN